MSSKSVVKRTVRHVVDRTLLPYVDLLKDEIGKLSPTTADHRTVAHDADENVAQPTDEGVTSDYFHMANHELRTLELERLPRVGDRVLSVGAQGRWYFDWFERAYGPVTEHIGIEAYEPRPDDLPEYVTWIPDTADQMQGVATGVIDLVYAGQTSEHLWAHELAGFLLEAHRVLRSGGVLALDSPNRIVTEHLHWSHGGHTIELSADEMQELLALAGFDVLTTTGVWRCVLNGERLQLEEGIADPAVFTRRAADGRETPDECFVWWINARRTDREPQADELRARVESLFREHWDTRVCRGLFPVPGSSALTLPSGTSGVVGSTLPFPLHAGRWSIGAELTVGTWADLVDFELRVMAPGDHLIHRLRIEDAVESTPTSLRWSVEQPYLLFALSLSVTVGSVRSTCALALPLQVRHDG